MENNGNGRRNSKKGERKGLFSWFRAPEGSFARTLADGSTVLDLQRARKSDKFEKLSQELEAFQLDVTTNGNGHSPAD